VRRGRAARRDLPPNGGLPGPVRRVAGGVLLLPLDRPREQMSAEIVAVLRRAGFRAVDGTGWEDYDALLLTSSLVAGKLVTSGYPEGAVQLAVRSRLRPARTALAVTLAVGAAAIEPLVGVAVALAIAFEIARGLMRARTRVRRTVKDAAQ